MNKMDAELNHSIAFMNSIPDTARDSEEAHWLHLARSGDESAFQWLLARYRSRAVRLASHILHGSEEAEDAAQEAFIRAFREIVHFREDSGFYTWLYQIVSRICFDRLRLSRFKQETSLPDDRSTSIDTNSDARLLVESLLGRLSPPMRATLVLREIEGLEYEEIAEILRIPVGTVRSRLNSARV
jgi:RNA polymerase sigma-70 factor (ECF subfamily)